MSCTDKDSWGRRRFLWCLGVGLSACATPAGEGNQASGEDEAGGEAETGGEAEAGSADASGGDGDGDSSSSSGGDGDGDGDGDFNCTAVDQTTGMDEPTPIELRDSCSPTPENIEGPFYRADAPFREDLLAGEDFGGAMIFRLQGLVTGTDCVPIVGAVVDLWQADPNGSYDNDGSIDVDPALFRLRGQVTTDPEGRYSFVTVLPGRYLNAGVYRPRHLHVKVRAEGFAELTTQLYFVDDPCLEFDPWGLPPLTLVFEEGGDGMQEANFDFCLGG